MQCHVVCCRRSIDQFTDVSEFLFFFFFYQDCGRIVLFFFPSREGMAFFFLLLPLVSALLPPPPLWHLNKGLYLLAPRERGGGRSILKKVGEKIWEKQGRRSLCDAGILLTVKAGIYTTLFPFPPLLSFTEERAPSSSLFLHTHSGVGRDSGFYQHLSFLVQSLESSYDTR